MANLQHFVVGIGIAAVIVVGMPLIFFDLLPGEG
jgi:hypothetical protein